MQRALRNTLKTENGTEKLDTELITALFENITTLAPLHQITRAERTTEDRPHNQKKRHISQKVTLSRFPPAIHSTDCSQDVFTCNVTTLDQCCVLIVRRRNNQTKWRRDVHGWNTQLNSTHPSAMGVHFRIHNWNRFVLFRGHQLLVSYPVPSHLVYASTCLPGSVFSVSSSISHLPQQSCLEATRFSNLCVSMEECVCRTTVHLDFNFIVSQISKHQHLLEKQCLLDAFSTAVPCFECPFSRC